MGNVYTTRDKFKRNPLKITAVWVLSLRRVLPFFSPSGLLRVDPLAGGGQHAKALGRPEHAFTRAAGVAVRGGPPRALSSGDKARRKA